MTEYDAAINDFMRTCKRLIHEGNKRIEALEKEVEMLRSIDESILEAKNERLGQLADYASSFRHKMWDRDRPCGQNKTGR